MKNVFVPKDCAAAIEALIGLGSNLQWRDLARLDRDVQLVIEGEPSLKKAYKSFTSANLNIPGSKIKPTNWEAWQAAARDLVKALRRVKRREIELCQRKVTRNAICGYGLNSDGSCPMTDRNWHPED